MKHNIHIVYKIPAFATYTGMWKRCLHAFEYCAVYVSHNSRILVQEGERLLLTPSKHVDTISIECGFNA